MVTITNYVGRTRKDGTTFIALEITGGVELVQSTNTGKFYATVRKTNIPSTFDESIAHTPFPPVLQGRSGKTPLSKFHGEDVRVLVDGAGVNTVPMGGDEEFGGRDGRFGGRVGKPPTTGGSVGITTGGALPKPGGRVGITLL